MTALNDTERAAQNWSAAARPDRPAPVRPERAETVPAARTGRYYPTWLPSRRFIAAVVAIGGMQLLATMERYGVKQIATDGKFDPNLHQAIAEVPGGGKPPGGGSSSTMVTGKRRCRRIQSVVGAT